MVILAIMLLALLLVATAISLYIYKLIKRAAAELKIDTERKRNRYILRAFSIILGIASVNMFSFSAVVILHFLLIAAVTELLNLVIKKELKIWKKVYAFSLIPFICTTVIMVFGYINLHNIQMTEYTVYTEKDIRPEGYRIALIADVHYGVSVTGDEFLKKCEEINSQNVDMVILCGDIVDDSTTKKEMQEVFSALSTIESEFGTYYVYGNHDRQHYSRERRYSEKELINEIEKNDITILCDDVAELNDEFVIVGREDYSAEQISGKEKRKTVKKLLAEVDGNSFILTLDHQPKEYKENAKYGTDLLLSGHTHGGQIWPVNVIDNIFKINDANYGLVEIDKDSSAIVTSGFAGWNYPIKTSAPSEYVIINVKKSQ